MIKRQLTLIMENKPGALARVVGLTLAHIGLLKMN